MLVSCPSGSDETWFEVYAGTSAPASGVEYKDNKVMGLSTWDGCAKAAFSGKLSTVGCVKNDKTGTISNVVKFAQSGKICLLIRSGGNTFTKDGITVTKIEFRGK
jgi:regulator of RNase E activity RraA